MSSSRLSRRHFLQLAAASAATAAVRCGSGESQLPDWPFRLGVASGDPLPDRVVLWTRLAPDPLAPRGGMPDAPVPVFWEVANDEGFSLIVRTGLAVASPTLAHSVHVDVNGLEPDRWYYYRFWAAGHASEVGRTRTMPAADGAPARLRFASASCQNFKEGFYTAYANLVEEDLDLVVFLGDYIYESGMDGPVRQHDAGRIQDLTGYRNRYAHYRSDPNLREAHARFPWIVTWDDHEVSNNYAGLLPDENAPSSAPPPERFPALRGEAYLAWYEHMPVRLLPPKTNALRIYRQLDFGDLASFLVLDTRQYRTDQDCMDEALAPICPEFPNPDGDMLGPAQESWLTARLGASSAIWNVLAQQVVFSPTPLGVALNYDQWDGYPIARQRVIDFLDQAAIRNPVVLTGDVHASGASFVPRDVAGFTGPLAAEFVATGISSGGLDESTAQLVETILQGYPHVKYFDAVLRGYIRHEVTRETWRADFRLVETTAQESSPIATAASFVVEDGNPDPQPA